MPFSFCSLMASYQKLGFAGMGLGSLHLLPHKEPRAAAQSCCPACATPHLCKYRNAFIAYPETLGLLRIIKSPPSPSGRVTMSGYLVCEQKGSIGSQKSQQIRFTKITAGKVVPTQCSPVTVDCTKSNNTHSLKFWPVVFFFLKDPDIKPRKPWKNILILTKFVDLI